MDHQKKSRKQTNIDDIIIVEEIVKRPHGPFLLHGRGGMDVGIEKTHETRNVTLLRVIGGRGAFG